MPTQRILHLALEREWFDDIAEGKKRHEYRAYKEYWRKRLEGKEFDIVRFRNGYASNAPEMDVEFVDVRRQGKNYVIRLGRVLKKKRWRVRG
jgi:ASC-1-like (ASCH) protein